ncbi:LLM class flavin-dependent oxidoreductase [Rhizobium leguminosarum]|nr:LLM class flavin-dependent oxidoreductase [Rhizobium leguminosarum]
MPISFGGSSNAAIAVAGKHSDIDALWGEPLDCARETIAKVCRAVHGERHPLHARLPDCCCGDG